VRRMLASGSVPTSSFDRLRMRLYSVDIKYDPHAELVEA